MPIRSKKKKMVAGVVLTSAALIAVVPAMVSAGAQNGSDTADNAWPCAPQPGSPVLVAVGDISCQPDANSTTQPGEQAKPGDTCTQNSQADTLLRNQAAADQWWQLLSSHGADLILNGHEHLYARFAPMNAAGQADKHGIREFIIGTGGEGLDPLYTDASGQVSVPNLKAAQGAGSAYQNGETTTGFPGAFGAMKLTLGQNGYSWDYQSAAAPTVNGSPAWGSFSDTGSARCHGPAQGN